MKLLLIAYAFPPFQDAQALRWYYLANGIAGLGARIDVLTVRHPSLDGRWKFHDNVKICRTFPGPLEYFALRAKRRIGVDERGNEVLRKSGKFKSMKRLYWGVRKTAGNILPGDARTEWFPFARRFVNRKIRLEDYTCVITSHEPWVDSLLGLYLKRKNPRIRWVADFGDPYITSYVAKHKLWFEGVMEESIYRNADKLIFTNGRVVQYLRERYPFLQEKKILTLPQGFSYDSYPRSRKGKPKEEVIKLLYTGTLYRNFRDPGNLIQALSAIGFEYLLLLAGKNEAFLGDFAPLGKNFRFLGFVDHFSALKLQQEADVLIHLGNKNSIQVPGKIYEYLGASRPILSIKYDAGDLSGKLVESLKCGVSCENKPVEIAGALRILHEEWRAGKCLPVAPGEIYEYSWENRAKILYAALERNRA